MAANLGSHKISMRKKVLVAMSGGVDSSTAAWLLKEDGYQVSGVTMCLGSAADTGDARKVCDVLGISHYVLDFSALMQKEVIDDFLDQYKRGRTPNPCVRCNQYLKFGKLLGYARAMGFDYLATGHYAKIICLENICQLHKARDKKKDQTYFLYGINKDDLRFILFPLAEYFKEDVRRLAAGAGIPTADRPESQDVCFIPKGGCRDFLASRLDMPAGDIVDSQGNVLGSHAGLARYTIGQREGLGIVAAHPLYVIQIDVKNNRIVVGQRQDLLAKALIVGSVNMLLDDLPAKAAAKIRYAHQEAACLLEPVTHTRVKVIFEQPQEALTPGQSIVFYSGDTIIGGGIIDDVLQ